MSLPLRYGRGGAKAPPRRPFAAETTRIVKKLLALTRADATRIPTPTAPLPLG
jgi:hypothetical protein